MNLLDLPNELLDLIVRSCRIPTDLQQHFINHEHGGSIGSYLMRHDINSLSQSCKKLNLIAIPALYEILCVTFDDDVIRDLEKTLRVNPELARYPRTVIVDYSNWIDGKMKIRFLENLPHVEHLYIQNTGPKKDQDTDWNDIWEGAMKLQLPGVTAPLSSLRTCKSLVCFLDLS